MRADGIGGRASGEGLAWRKQRLSRWGKKLVAVSLRFEATDFLDQFSDSVRDIAG